MKGTFEIETHVDGSFNIRLTAGKLSPVDLVFGHEQEFLRTASAEHTQRAADMLLAAFNSMIEDCYGPDDSVTVDFHGRKVKGYIV